MHLNIFRRRVIVNFIAFEQFSLNVVMQCLKQEFNAFGHFQKTFNE